MTRLDTVHHTIAGNTKMTDGFVDPRTGKMSEAQYPAWGGFYLSSGRRKSKIAPYSKQQQQQQQ